MDKKKERIIRKRTNVRGKIKDAVYRLSVHRSNKYLFVQIIEVKTGKTILGLSDKVLLKDEKGTKSDKARVLGQKFAEQAKKNNIEKVVFDRGSFNYHGRVKAFAEGAREKGLLF